MKRLLITLFCIAALAVQAQDLELRKAGGGLGLIFPDNPWDNGFKLGATAYMGELMDGVHLYLIVNYWSSSTDLGIAELSLSNFQLGADIHYNMKEVDGTYLGGGINLNFFGFDVVDFFGNTSDESETRVGLALLGGYQKPLGKMTGFAEARYNIIADFNTFELVAGLLFEIR